MPQPTHIVGQSAKTGVDRDVPRGPAAALVKGTAVRSLLLGLEQATSAADVARVRAAMPEVHRRALEPVVLASKYYPLAVHASVHETIRTELGGGGCLINRRAGFEAARIDFRGVYGIFVRVADFQTTLRLMDRAWKRYNTHGDVHVRCHEGQTATVHVDGVDRYNEGMWHCTAGRAEGILTIAGAAKAMATVVSWSPTGCEYQLRWTR
jgi:hypothetical protein